MDAIIVFHDRGTGFLSRFLKPGFRHCFVVIRNGDYWITVDGCEGVPLVQVTAPGDYDLAAFWREAGHTVIETEQRTTVPRSPFAIANCVGLSKAVLCVRSTAITPYGLYKHLRRKA